MQQFAYIYHIKENIESQKVKGRREREEGKQLKSFYIQSHNIPGACLSDYWILAVSKVSKWRNGEGITSLYNPVRPETNK